MYKRQLIGTYKGLGYAGGAIAGKYLLYAGIASILGSAAGVAIGNVVLPRVVFGAYSIMFTLPPLQIGFYPETAVTSAVLAVLITTLAAYFACRRELAGVPSQLMRPRVVQTEYNHCPGPASPHKQKTAALISCRDGIAPHQILKSLLF